MLQQMLMSMLGDNPEKMIADMVGMEPGQIDIIGKGLFALATEGLADIKATRADVAAIKRHLNIPDMEADNGGRTDGG